MKLVLKTRQTFMIRERELCFSFFFPFLIILTSFFLGKYQILQIFARTTNSQIAKEENKK